MAQHRAETVWNEAGYANFRPGGGGRFIDGREIKPMPVPTSQEAVSAARRLWTREAGKRWAGKIEVTSGNRYTWPRRGILYVNPDRGWWHLIHDLSHAIHRHRNRGARPHSEDQEIIESRMVKYALAQGWLDGKLERKPKAAPETPKPSLQQRRAARVFAAMDRAQHRLKLAQAAVNRLRPKVRYYERAVGDEAAVAALRRQPK